MSLTEKKEYDLIIALFGCAIKNRFIRELLVLTNKLLIPSKNYPNVKVIFLLGEKQRPEFQGEEYVYLPGVKDDYESATYKQNWGLKYILDNYNPKFIYVAGTDVYINLPRMLNLISKCDCDNDNVVFTSDKKDAIVKYDGKTDIEFIPGGPGILMSRKCLQLIKPYLQTLYDDWRKLCIPKYYFCCDVALSYLFQYKTNTQRVYCREEFCDLRWTERKIDRTRLIACHCDYQTQQLIKFYS